jgi:hypothetical protein
MFRKVIVFSLLLVFMVGLFVNLSYAELTIAPSGNVGIGTTTPSQKLHINNGHVLIERSASILYFHENDQTDPAGWWRVTADGDQLSFRRKTNAGTWAGEDYPLRLYGSTGDVRIGGSSGYLFYDRSASNVGIGTTVPSYKLHVNGTAYATGGAGVLSDIRYKKNVQPISDGALNIINSLRPVTYEWKNPADRGMEGTQIGFIAQEVEKFLPGVVLTQDDEDKTKAMKYNEFIPVLVKAIQEVKAENEQLKNTLTALADRQTVLEDKFLTFSTTLPKEKPVKPGDVQE